MKNTTEMQTPPKKLSKRVLVARSLAYSRVFSLSRFFLPGSRLAIFNFHRVAAQGHKGSSLDDALYDSDEATFRKELGWMKSQADPISEGDLLSFVQKKTPLPKRCFLITFDDGYRDNYEVALPILRELNVPVIFFIPTQLIEQRELGWWDQVSWALKNTRKSELNFRGEKFELGKEVTSLADIFNHRLKTLASTKTKDFVTELLQACEVDPPSKELSDSQLMTWDQIKSAQEKGVAIGSHTHTHRVLSCLDVASQKAEMETSKRILESKLGKPVRSIAYPVGGRGHFTDASMALAQECGYEVAFSFMDGINRSDSFDRFNIQRITSQKDEATYSGVFNLPWIFARG
jgi:peptidoglycan/xylan/chitin deacetylase (PgdA/CDA1 family)